MDLKRREFAGALAAMAAASQLSSEEINAMAGQGSITDVQGVKVGHFTDTRRPTGCTVVTFEKGAAAGVDVRGSAPGTRETDLLNPLNMVQQVHAILLSGGSTFGLDAASRRGSISGGTWHRPPVRRKYHTDCSRCDSL